MRRPDITLALTAHSETIVAGPTMRSAEAAIRAAEAEGFTVERLIGLDRASEGCRDFFLQPDFDHWNSADLEEGDLGLARNALTRLANGRWIAFLDADDLFSENWLVEGAKRLRQAEADGEKLILHPNVNWFFDAATSVMLNQDEDDVLMEPTYWHLRNYYDSLAMAPKAAFEQVPYAARDKANGFGYEDWRWNLETQQAGWRHVAVRDTIIFKRRRDTSLLSELGAQQTLLWDIDALAIDAGRPTAKGRAEQA